MSETLVDVNMYVLIGCRWSFFWLKTMKSGKLFLLSTTTSSTHCPSNLTRQSIWQHLLPGQITSFLYNMIDFVKYNISIWRHIWKWAFLRELVQIYSKIISIICSDDFFMWHVHQWCQSTYLTWLLSLLSQHRKHNISFCVWSKLFHEPQQYCLYDIMCLNYYESVCEMHAMVRTGLHKSSLRW